MTSDVLFARFRQQTVRKKCGNIKKRSEKERSGAAMAEFSAKGDRYCIDSMRVFEPNIRMAGTFLRRFVFCTVPHRCQEIITEPRYGQPRLTFFDKLRSWSTLWRHDAKNAFKFFEFLTFGFLKFIFTVYWTVTNSAKVYIMKRYESCENRSIYY